MYDRKILEKAFFTARKNSLIIPPNLRVEGFNFGEWSGNEHDDGFIFEETREYEPGDKLGDIDRASLFRYKELLTIRYEATRELKTLIVFDMSASMKIREKFKVATAVFARIFFSTLDSYIPTHIWFKGDNWNFSKIAIVDVSEYWYIGKDIFLDLSEHGKTSEYNNELNYDDWATYLPKKSLIFVVSDFLGDQKEEMFEFIDYYINDYRIIPIIIQDNLEYSFLDADKVPLFGITLDICDTDTGNVSGIKISRRRIRDVLNENEKRFKKIEDMFKDKRLSFAHLDEYDWEDINERLQEALDLAYT